MELKEVQKRALDIRNKYSEFEKRNNFKEWNNSDIMEGFVGDVGDLMKFVMAKEGKREIADVDRKIEHEIVDCLYSILVLAGKYGVDLEKAFLDNMSELENRIES